MLYIKEEINEVIFAELSQLWILCGVGNPVRGDNLQVIRQTLERDGKILTLYKDEVMIGTCWLTSDARRLYVHHMAVHPEYRNSGCGGLLMQQAVDYAQQLGLQLKLEVHQDNPSAKHLYEKWGFTELEGYITMIKRS